MRSKSIVIAVGLLLASQPALARTIYLSCEMPLSAGAVEPWTIAVNEEAGRVTATHPKATRTVRASFTPDHIIWDRGDFSLDRVTLVLTIRMTLFGKPLGEPRSGQCEIDSRERAI